MHFENQRKGEEEVTPVEREPQVPFKGENPFSKIQLKGRKSAYLHLDTTIEKTITGRRRSTTDVCPQGKRLDVLNSDSFGILHY